MDHITQLVRRIHNLRKQVEYLERQIKRERIITRCMVMIYLAAIVIAWVYGITHGWFQ